MTQESGIKISEMVRYTRAIGFLGRDAAPEVAAALTVELERQIAAGQDPYGNTWPLTKKEGRQALQNAAKAILVYVDRGLIMFRVMPPESLHDLGIARKGTPRRRIIPSKAKLPARWDTIIKGVLNARFKEAAGG